MKAIEMITDSDRITVRRGCVNVNIIGNTDWEQANLEPNTRYACCMIPIPEGFRLATEEDFKDGPRSARATSDLQGVWDVMGGRYDGGCNSIIYAIPIETEAQNRRKELEKRLKDAEAMVASVRKDLAKEDK